MYLFVNFERQKVVGLPEKHPTIPVRYSPPAELRKRGFVCVGTVKGRGTIFVIDTLQRYKLFLLEYPKTLKVQIGELHLELEKIKKKVS